MAQVKKEKGGVNVSRIMSLVFAVVTLITGGVFACLANDSKTSDYAKYCQSVEGFSDGEKFFCESLTNQNLTIRYEVEITAATVLFAACALFILKGIEKK